MYLPKVGDMTDAEKTAREGELRFMRAYFYFDLVQQFGRIPLLTEGNVSEIKTDFKRASVADVYAFIISDLRQAYEVLPDVAMQADRGRATKWSAANLLSKVYLTRGALSKISADNNRPIWIVRLILPKRLSTPGSSPWIRIIQ